MLPAMIAILIATPSIPSSATAGPAPQAVETQASVELGLAAPLGDLRDIERFASELSRHLVWTVRLDGPSRQPGSSEVALRLTAVRMERGRVTASYRSERASVPTGLSVVAKGLDAGSLAAFPDVCLTPADPPARVRAASGSSLLDAEALERAIAMVARTGELDGGFGFDEPGELDWGRHVVLILAATSEEARLLVRPLVLVLERP